MSKYCRRIAKIIILPNGEPIYSERATSIEIDDEAAGEFVVITQDSRERKNIAFDAEEWVHIKDAIDFMFKQIEEFEKSDY